MSIKKHFYILITPLKKYKVVKTFVKEQLIWKNNLNNSIEFDKFTNFILWKMSQQFTGSKIVLHPFEKDKKNQIWLDKYIKISFNPITLFETE